MLKILPQIAIAIPTFERPDYVRRCFESLKKTDVKEALIIVVDDGSRCDKTIKLVEDFKFGNNVLHKIYKNHNIGMWDSFVQAYDYAIEHYPQINKLVTLDSDTIQKKNWLNRVVFLFTKYKCKNLVTGFNSIGHPAISVRRLEYVKQSCGGINVVFSKEDYLVALRNVFLEKRNRWDWAFSQWFMENKRQIICAKPSVIQHIGLKGLNSNNQRKYHAYAEDY